MRGRHYNRHQQERAKARSRRTWLLMDRQDGADTGRADDPRMVGRRANTRTFATQEDRSGRGRHRRRKAEQNKKEQLGSER